MTTNAWGALASIAVLSAGLAGCTGPGDETGDRDEQDEGAGPTQEPTPAYLPPDFWSDTSYHADLAAEGLEPWEPIPCALDDIRFLGPPVEMQGIPRDEAGSRIRELFPAPWHIVESQSNEEHMSFWLRVPPDGRDANITLDLAWATADAWTTTQWRFEGNVSAGVPDLLASTLLAAAEAMAGQPVGAWNVLENRTRAYDPWNFTWWALNQEMPTMADAEKHPSRYRIARFLIREPGRDHIEGRFYAPLAGMVQVHPDEALRLASAYEECNPGPALEPWCGASGELSMGIHLDRLAHRVATCADPGEPSPRCDYSPNQSAAYVAIDAYTGATLGQFEYGDLMKAYDGTPCDVV